VFELVEVNEDNWRDCINLELLPEQEGNLASNAATLAQSKFQKNMVCLAVVLDDKVIGMMAYRREDEPGIVNLYWLFRFMIDQSYQSSGYGKQALTLLVQRLRESGGDYLRTMHTPTNLQASHTYLSFGFSVIGKMDDGDTLCPHEFRAPHQVQKLG